MSKATPWPAHARGRGWGAPHTARMEQYMAQWRNAHEMVRCMWMAVQAEMEAQGQGWPYTSVVRVGDSWATVATPPRLFSVGP